MKKYLKTFFRWFSQIANPIFFVEGIKGFIWYMNNMIKYYRMAGAERIRLSDTYPQLHDKTSTQKSGGHYFYQNIWAFKLIKESNPKYHYDVGSLIDYLGFLSTITRVVGLDYRPLKEKITNIDFLSGNILGLPFKSGTINSLSCLHVAEHIGLGRYGDPLDPYGTVKACKELTRVLARGGKLYFSLPIGIPRLCYNAHRIHSYEQIINYFDSLTLKEFSCIDDNGLYIKNASSEYVKKAKYACGLFLFEKL